MSGSTYSLRSRCSIIAAVDLVFERYAPFKSLSENVNLSARILSNFDICCVAEEKMPLRDTHPVKNYQEKGSHILSPLTQSTDLNFKGDFCAEIRQDVEVIPPEVLNKYILHARKNICVKRQNFEWVLRRRDAYYQNPSSVKNIIMIGELCESRVRLQDAYARMELRESLLRIYLADAWRLLLQSYIDRATCDDVQITKTNFEGYLIYKRDTINWLCSILDEMFNELETSSEELESEMQFSDIKIQEEALIEKIRNSGIPFLHPFYSSNKFRSFYEEKEVPTGEANVCQDSSNPSIPGTKATSESEKNFVIIRKQPATLQSKA